MHSFLPAILTSFDILHGQPFHEMAISTRRAALQEITATGYHILKITYERVPASPSRSTPAISDTAIMLLPIPSDPSQNSNWQQAKIYWVIHGQALTLRVQNAVVINSMNVERILGRTTAMAYLFFTAPNGAGVRERCVLPPGKLDVFRSILENTKPLWDEHAIVYQSQPNGFGIGDCGTYADQAADNLIPYLRTVPQPPCQPLFCWEPRGQLVSGSLNAVDQELELENEPVPELGRFALDSERDF
ncbi:hypothetical protein BDV96DRAFT_369621 [Lophiotrema nucula]|uniref:Uncharacterized protein n=1 Tax=Lophiotrema nucula TaxID=690887 RepID=A0A6A5ZLA0_9PLEO|nr:hypothetical protein BDV96DRAFT_369621 [Lophiotrema nucula]